MTKRTGMRKRMGAFALALALLWAGLPFGPARAVGAYTGFPDVAADFWAADSIAAAAARGLVSGYEDGMFRPDRAVTRAELVTMLWRLSGSPTADDTTFFSDVPPGSWFFSAIAWAVQAGYVQGKSAELFDPDGAVTRQEVMTILFRHSGAGAAASDYDDLAFSDREEIASWAKAAVSWAVSQGLMTGVADGVLAPNGQTTRAQMATILVRYTGWQEQTVPSRAGVYRLSLLSGYQLLPRTVENTEISPTWETVEEETVAFYPDAVRFVLEAPAGADGTYTLVLVMKNDQATLGSGMHTPSSEDVVYFGQWEETGGVSAFPIYPSALEDGAQYGVYVSRTDMTATKVASFCYRAAR